MPGAKRFQFDRTFQFDATADELWSAIADTRSYPLIWSWLDEFESGPLVEGTRASFRVRPPLPYRLRFAVTLDEVRAPELVRGRVSGDAAGEASLVVLSTDSGSAARLSWDLEVVRPSLARAAPLLRPLMVAGHDAVVAMGVRQFRRRAL